MKDPRWFAYMVRCSDGTLYTGATPDLERRVRMHNEGRGAKYTRGRGPVMLCWAELYASKSEAMMAEAGIKALPRSKKEALITPHHVPATREVEILIWATMSKEELQPVPMSIAEDRAHYGDMRQLHLAKRSWAVATEEAIRTIASLSPLVEMGAGCGYWASLLRRAGADVVAYDRSGIGSPHFFNPWHTDGQSYFKVRYGTPETLQKHPDRNLFLCWPPGLDSMALECLRVWNGQTLAYVGDFDGVTANRDFYQELRDSFNMELEVQIPNWIGAKDSLTIWKRK